MVSQFLLEPAVRALAGSVGQATDFKEEFVSAKLVQEAVSVGLSEHELHDVGTEHGFGRVARVSTVPVRFFEQFDKRTGAGCNTIDQDFQEAVAAFRVLLRLFAAVKI